MSAILQFEAIVAPALIAWLVLRRYLAERGPAADIELAGIAVAFGIGFTSIMFFLWRLLGMPPRAYPAADIGLQALLAGALWNTRRPAPPRVPAAADAKETKALRVLSAVAVAVAVCVAAALFHHFLAITPYGEWDGWAIWNLRAAFLSARTDHWRDGFTPVLQWSHPDYPLLIPASVARLWSVADVSSAFGPQLLAVSVVVSTALVLAGSVARRAGFLATALALSLLMVPNYLRWGVSQTADVPLGLYTLIAVASVAAARSAPQDVVAGLAVGFAVWTKNEGLVVAAAVLITIGAVCCDHVATCPFSAHLPPGLLLVDWRSCCSSSRSHHPPTCWSRSPASGCSRSSPTLTDIVLSRGTWDASCLRGAAGFPFLVQFFFSRVTPTLVSVGERCHKRSVSVPASSV